MEQTIEKLNGFNQKTSDVAKKISDNTVIVSNVIVGGLLMFAFVKLMVIAIPAISKIN